MGSFISQNHFALAGLGPGIHFAPVHDLLRRLLPAIPVLLITARGGFAADDKAEATATWLAEHYTKYEYRIPMRDGVHLHTRVYLPKDDSEAWPILLTRTPYSLKPYGVDNYGDPSGSFQLLARDKFILVTQDVRGRYGSEGLFVHARPYQPNKSGNQIDESSDAWDTIDWLVKHVPNNNGKVGMFGISYPGFYTSMGMIDSHPALKAASPQAPVSDWFMGDDLHHNGALFLAQNFSFLHGFSQKLRDVLHEPGRDFFIDTPDGYEYFLRMGPLANSDSVLFQGSVPEWTEFLAHPDYDAFWQARNIRPHLKNVHCAVLNVGGWYDAEDFFGTLETYRATERLNPGITNLLVVGPWTHGMWGRATGDKLGNVSFHANTGDFYREKIELPFFRHFLKGDNQFKPTEAQVFETGTCVWRKYDAWPPKESSPRTLYLHAGGGLSFQAPAAAGEAFDEYVSDPAKPVPFTMEKSTGYPRAYPVEDQRFAASRPDVLVYETEPLETDLTMVGPIKTTLQVSTTGTDADWVVKLIDVYPGDYAAPGSGTGDGRLGGCQQLVRGDVFRGKYRHSFEKPEPFEPGRVARVEFAMPDICHAFRRGHRIMVQVQSSWFPLVDRNPQTFLNIATAKAEDFHKATQRVYCSGQTATTLTMQVMPGL